MFVVWSGIGVVASLPDLQRKEGGLVLTVRVFVRMRQIIRISYHITHRKSVNQYTDEKRRVNI